MSGFNNGRRGPSISHYLSNLNAIPSSHEIVSQNESAYSLEDDLAIFTNAEFLDYDMSEDIDHQPMPYDPSQEGRARRENAAAHKTAGKALEFGQNHGEYFSHMAPYLSPSASISATLDPNFANISTTYSPPTSTFPATVNSPATSVNMGDLSPVASPTSPTTTEIPASRLAAEEDKRRRNTAASARFRVKKKQREQALERQAKDLADKTKALEDRVVRLETENEWLRGLVVERDGREGLEEGMEGWRRRKGKGAGVGGTGAAGRASTSAAEEGTGTGKKDGE